ncbi:MAG TPA: protein kinase, partial [Mycobacteriales bacterium]
MRGQGVLRQRDAGALLRFAREQSLRLHHPHLLTPYAWAAEDAHVAIVSPLVARGSLHTLLGDHGPLAPELVADLLDQLLDGLDYAHRNGIVHRDVTPANVLLEATGAGRPVLRLADFGLAVRVGEPRLTRLGTVLGTPGYVPPEVLAGAAPAPAADLYAAGRVALALLTGTDRRRQSLTEQNYPLRNCSAAGVSWGHVHPRPGSAVHLRRSRRGLRADREAGRARHHPAGDLRARQGAGPGADPV